MLSVVVTRVNSIDQGQDSSGAFVFAVLNIRSFTVGNYLYNNNNQCDRKDCLCVTDSEGAEYTALSILVLLQWEKQSQKKIRCIIRTH
jgi:hypothetical protein